MQKGNLVFSILFSMLLAPMVSASENACKGVTETQCAASEACRWVASYARKDGREVNGYCRLKHKAKTDVSLSDHQKNKMAAVK